MNDWRLKAIQDFCKIHDVEIWIADECFCKKIMMRKGDKKAVKTIDYDWLPTWLPSATLNELYKEITS